MSIECPVASFCLTELDTITLLIRECELIRENKELAVNLREAASAVEVDLIVLALRLEGEDIITDDE